MENVNRFLSIGEVAKSLNVTRRMILNYEERGLVQPDQRNGATGNRYYTIDTLTRIRTIRVLQTLGLSLDEIYRYYDGKTDLQPLVERLETLRDELNLNIERLRERVKGQNDSQIQQITISAQTIYYKTFRTNSIEDKKERLRDVSITAMRQYGSDTSKRMYFIEYPIEDPQLITYCVAVPAGSRGECIRVLPDVKTLSIFYHGGYETIVEAREQIQSYAAENKIKLQNVCRHIYLEGPPHHKEKSKYITQVAVLLDDELEGVR